MVPIHPDAARTGLPPEMRLYLKCLVGFSFLGATILLFNYFVLKSTWPHWFPFFSPNARFTDFTIFRDRFRYFHQASFFATEGFPSAGYPFSYPAPAAVVLNLFLLPVNGTRDFYSHSTSPSFFSERVGFIWLLSVEAFRNLTRSCLSVYLAC